MQHPECESEVEHADQAEIIRSALVEFDPPIETAPRGTATRSAEHLGLNIDGDYAPGRTDELGERQSEIPEPAPKVCNPVSAPDQTVKDGAGIMDIAPQWIVEGVTEPPRTSVLIPGYQPVENPHD